MTRRVAVGDRAAIPDVARGQGVLCPPSAQHAVRQARGGGRQTWFRR